MSKLIKTKIDRIDTHNKTWGKEAWIENLPEYCGKILYIEDGKYGSMHFHVNKLETMLVISGRLSIDFIDTETGERYGEILDPYDSIKIPRGQPHRLLAEDGSCQVIEFSTHHEDSDSYRIEGPCK
jgi:mannose-6-phosphate isomerase-like protein (cupin superfamily)